ncbi:MAG TPA: phosphotransferase [Symbiobacteriaceae bacterium]|nr:phosphotransferase [Symbiobacteriaceae bacterium]
MIDLIRQLAPDAIAVEEQHGSGRVRHLRLTRADGVARPCVLRRAPAREHTLYETWLKDPATGAPALLGAAPAGDGQVWLLLEGVPEEFPDFTDPTHVTTVYRHLAAMHIHFTDKGAAAPRDLEPILAEFSAAHAEKSHLLAGGPTTFVHGDYHRWNLVVTGGRIRVLDWELAAFAHPVWDLTLLAPEEPGWDGVPRGAGALLALRTYHEAGPLARLSWDEFLYRQRLARLYIAARWCLTHRAKAAALPPGGARLEVETYAEAEAARIRSLLTQL